MSPAPLSPAPPSDPGLLAYQAQLEQEIQTLRVGTDARVGYRRYGWVRTLGVGTDARGGYRR